MDQPILISSDQLNLSDSQMFHLDQYATGEAIDQSLVQFEARECNQQNYFKQHHEILEIKTTQSNDFTTISSIKQENMEICQSNLPEKNQFSNENPLDSLVKQERNNLTLQSNEVKLNEKEIMNANPNPNSSQIKLENLTDGGENSYLNEENLELQKRNLTEVRNLFCEICNLEILDYNTFTQHRRSHTNEKKFACEICKRCFSAAGLKLHRTSRTCEKDFNCEICDMKFTSLDFLKSHKLNHAEVEKKICKKSNEIFSTPASLDHHRTLQADEKEFINDVRNGTFITPDSIEIHHRSHTGEKPFSSEDSDERIPNSNFCHRCEECNKRFSTLTSLEIHQRSHTGERPFGCEDCGKRFLTRNTLMSHRRLHKNSFVCHVCGRRHSCRSKLMDHLRIHTGEKPFVCNDCPRRFRTLGLLNLHVVIHDDGMRFVCDICNKRFANPPSLERHRKSHVYMCEVCDLTFNNVYALKRHRKVHVKAEPN